MEGWMHGCCLVIGYSLVPWLNWLNYMAYGLQLLIWPFAIRGQVTSPTLYQTAMRI